MYKQFCSLRFDQSKFFISGGLDIKTNNVLSNFFQYDVNSKKIFVKENMLNPRYDHCMCLTEDFIFVFGGQSQNGTVLKQCQKFS